MKNYGLLMLAAFSLSIECATVRIKNDSKYQIYAQINDQRTATPPELRGHGASVRAFEALMSLGTFEVYRAIKAMGPKKYPLIKEIRPGGRQLFDSGLYKIKKVAFVAEEVHGVGRNVGGTTFVTRNISSIVRPDIGVGRVEQRIFFNSPTDIRLGDKKLKVEVIPEPWHTDHHNKPVLIYIVTGDNYQEALNNIKKQDLSGLIDIKKYLWDDGPDAYFVFNNEQKQRVKNIKPALLKRIEDLFYQDILNRIKEIKSESNFSPQSLIERLKGMSALVFQLQFTDVSLKNRQQKMLDDLSKEIDILNATYPSDHPNFKKPFKEHPRSLTSAEEIKQLSTTEGGIYADILNAAVTYLTASPQKEEDAYQQVLTLLKDKKYRKSFAATKNLGTAIKRVRDTIIIQRFTEPEKQKRQKKILKVMVPENWM